MPGMLGAAIIPPPEGILPHGREADLIGAPPDGPRRLGGAPPHGVFRIRSKLSDWPEEKLLLF